MLNFDFPKKVIEEDKLSDKGNNEKEFYEFCADN